MSIAHPNQYQETWESRSSIRTRPRKFIDFSQSGYFFPQNKQPILFNQSILSLDEDVKEFILFHSFYKYLHDIIDLEIKLISNVCNKIIFEDLEIIYSDEIKLNSCTILIDEYYHVYIARDMIVQLNHQYPNIKKFEYPVSDSYNAVMLVKSKLDKKYHTMFEIIAVCIFETTLVRELVEFFNSENVHPSVKYYVNDYMNDESRHYGFFYNLLCYTWEKLPEDYKKNIGKNLAYFLKNYLNITSEKTFNINLLLTILDDKKKSEFIVEELYQGFDITPEIPIVKNVLNVLQKSQLLQNKHVKKSFQDIGWSI